MSPLRPAQADNAQNKGTESFVAKAATDDDTQVDAAVGEKKQPPDEHGLDEINLETTPAADAGADNREISSSGLYAA